MIHWQLTSQQFEAALFAMDRDRLPYPIWNAMRATEDDELIQQRREGVETLLPRVDDELARLLHILVDPQVRVHVHGRRGGTGDRPELEQRGYAGFGPSSVAAVAIQEPDPQPGVSGAVTLSLCTSREGLGLLARMIGEHPAGRHELSEPKSDLDLDADWIGDWNRPPTGRERVDQFFSRPREGWGEVLCYPGTYLDDRTDAVQGFGWIDFARDGRYFVCDDESGYTATPMSPDQFVRHVHAVAVRVRERASRPTTRTVGS